MGIERFLYTTLFAIVSFSNLALSQLSIPYTIQHIAILPRITEFTTFPVIEHISASWSIVQANGVILPFTFSNAVSTIELMEGTVAAASNKVLDVLSTNILFTFTSTTFSLRSSLPTGSYHLRVNSVVNTTIGSDTTIQHLSARGVDFHWTLPAIVGCGPGLEPDPFTPIPSITSPAWTSFMILKPPAGGNFPLLNSSFILTSWNWRNNDNADGNGISSLSIQAIKATDGSVVGAPIKVTKPGGSLALNPVTMGMQAKHAYKLRVKYINNFQDGVVSPGKVVTYTSDEFNILASDVNPNVDCPAH
ncbi:hypothetical protein VKT23_012868 [Stygiomarasmius scandens]|uniref:Uncharacterized protein n=1 Tax=Marasmiellus scandens TaxID=2682957 RepID=A0ABR1J590_9AGAR